MQKLVIWVQVAYMEMLKSKGMELYAAYGNTTTDIRAYAAAGIPKVRHRAHPGANLHHVHAAS